MGKGQGVPMALGGGGAPRRHGGKMYVRGGGGGGSGSSWLGYEPPRADRRGPERSERGRGGTGARRRCASCGTTSTPMWRKGMQRGELVALCNACGIRVKRGKCCPYCQVTYDGEAPADDHDDPWSQCTGCARWLHAACYQHAKPAGAPAGAARCADCLRGGAAPAPPAKKARRSSQATPAAASGASSLPHVPKGARSSSGTTKRRRSSAALPREDGAARRGCGALSAAALRAGSRGTEHNVLAPSTPQPLRPTASWEDLLPVDRARLLMRAVNQPRPSVVKQPAAADCAATGGPAQQLCGVQVAA